MKKPLAVISISLALTAPPMEGYNKFKEMHKTHQTQNDIAIWSKVLVPISFIAGVMIKNK